MRLRLFPLLLATWILGCTTAVHVHSAKSPTASFDRYRTFALDMTENAPSGYASSARSAEVRKRVRQYASALLEGRGFVLTAIEGKPDLVLRIAAGRAERVFRHAVPWLEEEESEDFVEGAFVIDAFDAASDQLVWHGAARGEAGSDRIDDDRLRRAVTSVLATFPAAVGPPR